MIIPLIVCLETEKFNISLACKSDPKKYMPNNLFYVRFLFFIANFAEKGFFLLPFFVTEIRLSLNQTKEYKTLMKLLFVLVHTQIVSDEQRKKIANETDAVNVQIHAHNEHITNAMTT